MSLSTATKYAIDLVEVGILREQRRRRVVEIQRDRVEAAITSFRSAAPPPARTLDQVTRDALEQEVDEAEVETEGWEDKGKYVFYLDLTTDLLKLVVYLAFFFILLVFYGLPIHIVRDVFLTMRNTYAGVRNIDCFGFRVRINRRVQTAFSAIHPETEPLFVDPCGGAAV